MKIEATVPSTANPNANRTPGSAPRAILAARRNRPYGANKSASGPHSPLSERAWAVLTGIRSRRSGLIRQWTKCSQRPSVPSSGPNLQSEHRGRNATSRSVCRRSISASPAARLSSKFMQEAA